MALDIQTAKKQAEILASYLKTVGKNVKHTHALEAIARINGHDSWKAFQNNENPAQPTLANRILNGEVKKVSLNGATYSVLRYDGLALTTAIEQEALGDADGDAALSQWPIEKGVQLEALDGSGTVWLWLEEVVRAEPLREGWKLPDGRYLLLHTDTPPVASLRPVTDNVGP